LPRFLHLWDLPVHSSPWVGFCTPATTVRFVVVAIYPHLHLLRCCCCVYLRCYDLRLLRFDYRCFVPRYGVLFVDFVAFVARTFTRSRSRLRYVYLLRVYPVYGFHVYSSPLVAGCVPRVATLDYAFHTDYVAPYPVRLRCVWLPHRTFGFYALLDCYVYAPLLFTVDLLLVFILLFVDFVIVVGVVDCCYLIHCCCYTLLHVTFVVVILVVTLLIVC